MSEASCLIRPETRVIPHYTGNKFIAVLVRLSAFSNCVTVREPMLAVARTRLSVGWVAHQVGLFFDLLGFQLNLFISSNRALYFAMAV